MRQKRFTKEIGDFNGASGVTEFEGNGFPNPQKGPKTLEKGFESIWEYEKLHPLVSSARNEFQKELNQSVVRSEIEKINLGLKNYVKSSTYPSESLDLLKASILEAFEPDLLEGLFNLAEEEVKCFYPKSYFENVRALQSIESSSLIHSESIIKYQGLAKKYTIDVIEEYISLCDNVEDDLNNFLLYRGQGNIHYYKTKEKAKNFADSLSIFTGIGHESMHYFERQVLNPFSINRTVAETFMVHRNNQRRVLLVSDLEAIMPNIFSSFIVSDVFPVDQYEILCLPNEDNLFIQEKVNDEISAEFHISSLSNPPDRMVRNSL